MKTFLNSSLVLIAFVISGYSPDDNPTGFADKIDQYMQAQASVNNFSGAILIARNDTVILSKGYGQADREWNINNTADTKFRIASNTKQFTAVCILQLAEQGKLSLDDTLGKYFSGFEYGSMVTVHMLLTHSSGVQDYYRYAPFNSSNPVFIAEDSMVTLMRNQLFDFLPGKDISYSNSGYYLLGLIIEKASGESYEQYVHTHIFQVTGMNNTGIDRFDTVLSKRAKGYCNSPWGVINAFDDNYRMGSLFAVGSVYSTVEDMYKFEKALDGNALLSNESKRKMFTQYGYSIAEEKRKEDPANTIQGAIDPYWLHAGYGVQIDTFFNHKRYFTRGFVHGFKSTIYKFPDDNILVIVLQNNEESPDRIAEPLSAILFGANFTIPYMHKRCAINPDILKKYTGKWIGDIYGVEWIVEVVIKDNKLYRRIDGYPDIELIPESDTKFFYADGQDKQMEFILDENGRVKEAWFIIGGIKFLRNRIP